MDSQLKELLEQIKQEGVQKAQSQGDQIIKDAEARARTLIADAEKEADSIREKAREDAEKTTQTGKDALAQAGRDLVLSLEGEIKRIFDTVIRRETESAMSGTGLADIIAALVTAWVEKNDTNLTVLLSEKDLGKVNDTLRDRLAKAMSQGVELKPAANLDQGFRVSTEGGSVYYDFSTHGIAEVLSAYVNPKLAQTIRESVSRE